MSSPRFCIRPTSLSNRFIALGLSGGGGSMTAWAAFLGLGLATSEAQLLEHLGGAGVPVPLALVGLLHGPAGLGIGDLHREGQALRQGDLRVEQADGVAGVQPEVIE